MSTNPMHHVVRPRIDYSLAETYLPGVILWCKTMAYTCIIPCFWYSEQAQLSVAGIFVIVLFYDHIYLNPCKFIDTTAIVVDVIAASMLTLARDANGCLWCSVNIACWFLVGGAHIFAPPEFPKLIVHIASSVIVMAELVLSRPMPLTQHGPLDFFAAFMRTNFYTMLVIIDIYLIRHPRQSDADRIYIFRYGSILLSSWPLTCMYALVLFVLQALYIYYHQQDLQQQMLPSLLSSVNVQAPERLLTPAQLRGATQSMLRTIPTPLPNSSSKTVDVALPQDLQEAFKLAQLQHASSKNA